MLPLSKHNIRVSLLFLILTLFAPYVYTTKNDAQRQTRSQQPITFMQKCGTIALGVGIGFVQFKLAVEAFKNFEKALYVGQIKESLGATALLLGLTYWLFAETAGCARNRCIEDAIHPELVRSGQAYSWLTALTLIGSSMLKTHFNVYTYRYIIL